MIYDFQSARLVLGGLLQDSSLLHANKYIINKEDFSECKFHEILFRVINYLSDRGTEEITPLDVHAVVEYEDVEREILEDNNYIDFIETTKEICNLDNFGYYYEELKKHSVLRAYAQNGFDITPFYNIDLSETERNKILSTYGLVDIIDYYESIQNSIRKNFLVGAVQEEYVAGTDFAQTKEGFKEEPLVGDSFQSPYLNAIFRGMYGFIIRGAKSGGGKTVTTIGELCNVSALEYWDEESQSFVANPCRAGAGLFINTEMELREEIDPIMVSWISGVERSHITDGIYDEGEEERVDYAGEILKNSEIYVVDDPEFTTKSLRTTIKDYVLNKGVKNVVFDYIQNNGIIGKEISSETNIPQREDMVLLALTDRIKQVQRECGIGMIAPIQTNGQEDNLPYPTEACLAGGKATVRKTNGTMIQLPPTKAELALAETILSKRTTGIVKPCNLVTHIIKGRASKYEKHIKVFQHADLGTGRTYDLFCTDKYNKLIKVESWICK